MPGGVDKTNSYIIFTWPQGEDFDVIETLTTQVDTLKEAESGSWNPRGKFLVVVPDDGDVPPRELGLQIYAELWKEHFIIDGTILIYVRDKYMKTNGTSYTDELILDNLYMYTGFPYESGNCGNVTDVILIDQWNLHKGTFMYNANLFPPKTPEDFGGCKIRTSVIGVPPFVILTGNSTDSDGNIVYYLNGLAVQNLLLAADKMNAKVVFLEPSVSLSFTDGARELGNLAARRSDIAIGMLPLLPLFLNPWFEPATPYEYVDVKWFVPCPKSVPRMEKIMKTYKLSVWLTMTIVFVLTTIVWWWLANWRDGSLKDSRTFETLSYCFYNAWAVSIGVSVSNTPNTWKFRYFFLLYVCYCFAMSTVFQAFFISYLVEPGYGKKLETFDELLHSKVAYGYNGAIEAGMASTSYTEHLQFPESKRQDCNDMTECIKRIANDAQLCTISDPKVSQYLATEIGIQDASKYLCSLEENLFTVGLISLLSNGNPFLNRLSVLTRRSLEGGLLDQYWAELIWLLKLRGKDRVLDDNDMYFVFSLSHLSPAFCILAFGYVLSSAVFLVEIFVKCIPNL
jgi:hypothetical protein